MGISVIFILRLLYFRQRGRLWRDIKQWVKTLSQWNSPLETTIFQYGTATGSCGTISWQIEGLKLRLIVMWSVPFNLNVHSSYLAVGMVYNEGRFSSSDYWFNQMYYGTHGPFKRAEAGQAITFENDKVGRIMKMQWWILSEYVSRSQIFLLIYFQCVK